MIRRRSTLDHSEKIKKNKQVETLAVLDLCLQIPVDDRLIIRNRIKDGDQQLISRIHQCRKNKDYHGLQVYLRKALRDIKQSTNRYGYSLPKKQCSSRTTSKHPSITRMTNIQTQGSYKSSLKNSLQSSPNSNKKKKQQNILSIPNMNRIQKKIQFEIDDEIAKQLRKQQFRNQTERGLTPREQEQDQCSLIYFKGDKINKQSYPYQYPSSNNTSNIKYSKPVYKDRNVTDNNESLVSINMKKLLKQKISGLRIKDRNIPTQYNNQNNTNNYLKQHPSNININNNNNINMSKLNTKQNIEKRLTINQSKCSITNKFVQDKNQQSFSNSMLYGQFYKKIKMTIQTDL